MPSVKGKSDPLVEDEPSSVMIKVTNEWAPGKEGKGLGFEDLEEEERGQRCCNRFRFVLWAIAAAAVIGGAVAVAVIMVKSNDKGSSEGKGGVADTGTPAATGSEPSGGGSKETSGSLLKVMEDPPFDVPGGWTALWWEEFDGSALNTNVWSYDKGYGQEYGLWAWGNQEQQYYTDSSKNVEVRDGKLLITALRETTKLEDGYTFNYTSGRVITKGQVGVYAGMKTEDGRRWDTIRVEASLKSPEPTEQGVWAAFWMLPVNSKYGEWASSGEIDIFEMKNMFTHNNMALHYGGPYPEANKRTTEYKKRPGGKTYYDSFTKATLDWKEDEITFSIDDEQQLTMRPRALDPEGYYTDGNDGGPNAPFDVPFYFIVNLAVGGKYPGNATDDTLLPNTFSVDYIRVLGKSSYST